MEAPVSPGPFAKEPALIIGVALAIVNGLLAVLGAGGFDDGFQWADLVPIIGPVLAALGIRQSVFSQRTVDALAPRSVQRRVVSRR